MWLYWFFCAQHQLQTDQKHSVSRGVIGITSTSCHIPPAPICHNTTWKWVWGTAPDKRTFEASPKMSPALTQQKHLRITVTGILPQYSIVWLWFTEKKQSKIFLEKKLWLCPKAHKVCSKNNETGKSRKESKFSCHTFFSNVFLLKPFSPNYLSSAHDLR